MQNPRFLTACLAVAALLSAPAAEALTTFRTVALTGQAAPGAGGAVFSNLGTPALNGAGDAAFVGLLT